ncbi:hypothetical protein ACK35I_06780 [Aeromonas veronii]
MVIMDDNRISEKKLTDAFKGFLLKNEIIQEDASHFDGDDETKSDVEISISNNFISNKLEMKKIYIEVKTHHSTDSQNTIHKVFGQLLKETGKRTLKDQECLAIMFPHEPAEWKAQGKTIKKTCGVGYYRQGFKKIDKEKFIRFGELVSVKYIFSFSSKEQKLEIYEWKDFLSTNVGPILILPK